MSLDQFGPGEILGHVQTFGLPHHGLAKAGKLTLPNGAQINHPTPPVGGSYEIRRPGWVMPARSEEQVAADAAQGREWRDYALMSGRLRSLGAESAMYLGGKQIDGWIWFDPTGASWKVRITSWGSGSNSAHALQLTFDRFGRFGADPESFTRSSPAIDLQQATATPFVVRRTDGGEPDALGANDSSIRHKMLDVRPDGSAAIFAAYVLHYSGPTATGESGPYIERVVAVYEIQINSDRSVSAQCLAGRDDCIGDHQSDWQDAVDVDISLFRDIPFSAPACGLGSYWSHDYAWEFDSLQTYALSEIATSVLTGPAIGLNSVWAGGAYYGWAGIGHFYGPPSQWRYRAVVGAWYSGGSARLVRFAVEGSREFNGAHSLADAGGSASMVCNNGTRTTSGAIGLDFAISNEMTDKVRFALLEDATPIVQDEYELVRSNTITGAIELSPPSTAYNVTYTSTIDWEMSKNGQPIDGNSTPFSGSENMRNAGVYVWLLGMSWYGPAWERSFADVPDLATALDFIPAYFSAGGESMRIAPAHWEEVTIGLWSQFLAATGNARHEFTDASSRGAAVSCAETVSTPGADTRTTPCGSRQPVTGEWSGEVVVGALPVQRGWL